MCKKRAYRHHNILLQQVETGAIPKTKKDQEKFKVYRRDTVILHRNGDFIFCVGYNNKKDVDIFETENKTLFIKVKKAGVFISRLWEKVEYAKEGNFEVSLVSDGVPVYLKTGVYRMYIQREISDFSALDIEKMKD